MPTYNRAAYIAEALKSVLNQTYSNIELIIVDDGSIDNTEGVISPYLKDNRLRYIKQKNAGASAARNHGLSLRTGKYVAFIDSDDIWEKDKITTQISVLNALPEVGIVCSDFCAINKSGRFEKSHIRSYFGVFNTYKLSYEDIFSNVSDGNIYGIEKGERVYWGNIYHTMIFGNMILTSTTLFRREVFDRGYMFDLRYKTLEDYDLFMKLTKEFAVAFVDKPLIQYRYSDTQLSGDLLFGELCDNLIDIFNRNIASIEDREFLENNKMRIRRHFGKIQTQKAYFHFSQENMRLAAYHYWLSIYSNPFNYTAYIYFLFSILPISATRFIRKLKSAKQ